MVLNFFPVYLDIEILNLYFTLCWDFEPSFYLTAFKGCAGIVLTHGIWMGGWLGGRVGGGKKLVRLYLRNPEV